VAAPFGAYSHAAVVPPGQRLIYVAGQVAIDESGVLVGKGDVAKQAEQTLENIRRILADCGAGVQDIVKLNWYLTDMTDREAILPLREKFLGAHRPASTTVEVTRLVGDDWLIEIDCVAAVPA
jgi:enamine deaminase RidA (YjgF/YER057c/UK114 family)